MPEQPRVLQECLEAVRNGGNLHQVLRHPTQREELIPLVSLALELRQLRPPAPDPAVRLRVRNRMLTAAAERRASWLRPFARWLSPRPALRLAAVLAVATTGLLGVVTAVADNSLPGEPLYGVKRGVEQARIAVTLDGAENTRLQLQLAERRLEEAQRLIDQDRVAEGLSMIDEYDVAVSEFDQRLEGGPLRDAAAAKMARFVDERQGRAHEQLQVAAGSLSAKGHPTEAASVAKTGQRVDQTFDGRKKNLQGRDRADSGGNGNGKGNGNGNGHAYGHFKG